MILTTDVVSVLSPAHDDYPMVVTKFYVRDGAPVEVGQLLFKMADQAGDWVNLVYARRAGVVEKVLHPQNSRMLGVGCVLTLRTEETGAVVDPAENATFRRLRLGDFKEALAQSYGAQPPTDQDLNPTRSRATRPERRQDRPRARQAPHQGRAYMMLSLATLLISLILATLFALSFRGEAPPPTIDQIWRGMISERQSEAARYNASPAERTRIDASARADGAGAACRDLFIGRRLSGRSMRRGERVITYLNPRTGTGSYRWSKLPDTVPFDCASLER